MPVKGIVSHDQLGHAVSQKINVFHRLSSLAVLSFIITDFSFLCKRGTALFSFFGVEKGAAGIDKGRPCVL
jgi:hypothetical protein